MSALEEYRRFTESPAQFRSAAYKRGVERCQDRADAAIAELEAENKKAVYGCCEECRALSEAEAERDALRDKPTLWCEDGKHLYRQPSEGGEAGYGL